MISPFISKQRLSKKKKLGLALLEKLWSNLEVKFSWEIFKLNIFKIIFRYFIYSNTKKTYALLILLFVLLMYYILIILIHFQLLKYNINLNLFLFNK